jgi:uncharacterized membrane protein YgcG
MPTSGRSPDGNYVQYDDSIRVGGDRNWRDNNPGNIEAGAFADAHGAIGSDGRFAIFPDADTGMRALQSLLTSSSYQGLTIEEAMEQYAPASENDTAAYTAFIANNVGVDPTTNMSDLTATQLAAFADAIETFEGGAEGTTYQQGDTAAPSWVQDAFDDSESDDPDPTSDTDPIASPSPEPNDPNDPTPNPMPAPTPQPLPAPTPDPDPTPTPAPGPTPDPVTGTDPGNGDSEGGQSGGDDGGGGGEGGGGGGGED